MLCPALPCPAQGHCKSELQAPNSFAIRHRGKNLVRQMGVCLCCSKKPHRSSLWLCVQRRLGLSAAFDDWNMIKEVRRLPCSVGEEAPQEIVDLMERCMQLDPEDRPDAAQCIEVISKYLRLNQAGSGKFRDAPMRTSSNDANTFRRRSSQSSSVVDTKSSAPRSGLSDQQRLQQTNSAEGKAPHSGSIDKGAPRSGLSDQQRAPQLGSPEGKASRSGGSIDLWGPRSGSSDPRTPMSGRRSGALGVLDVPLPEEGPPVQQ